MIAKNPSTTYVFFIDDLDRVSPLAAIEILDILKNVFFANRCIFVVAIDFDVVSKGLVEKYHLNEVEPHISRDYFDKIFQFSYQIPFNQGASTGLMWDGLKSIGYFGEGDDKGVIDEALQTSAALFDFNPRKIKRLISYMSYRKAFDAYNNHYLRSGTVYLRSTALVLAAIEVSMPDFIRHLCQYPHFSNPSIAALRDLSQDFEWAESSVGTKPNWQEAYRKALNGSPFKDQSLSILHALKTVQRFLQCDRHINFHTVLGLSNFVAASNGDVGIEDNEFSETVETSYLYGMRLLDMIEPSRGLSVLHLGCQDGAVSREILLRMPESYVRALEMQQSLAEAAKETLVSSGMDASRFDVEYRQIEDVNEHGKYDIVFSATAAHWIKQLAYVKAFDALKHGGRLYFEQSGKGTYEDMHKTLIEVVADIVPGKRGDIASIEPFYFPTAEELAAYLEKIGFTDVSVTEEIDSGERFDTLYEDYISTNARPYLEKMTEGEVSEIRDCFLNACHNENVGKSANILWITATKA